MLKRALPVSGVKVLIYPFLNIIMIAPKIIKKTETNRTVIVMICNGLVFEMLLKEKDAPEMKKRLSQNSKVLKRVTSAKSFESVLPVIMHLEIDTPNR
jgi:hypothetical protein